MQNYRTFKRTPNGELSKINSLKNRYQNGANNLETKDRILNYDDEDKMIEKTVIIMDLIIKLIEEKLFG
jgi:hypothetical protein